jgi:hypothetical protein
MAVIISSWLVDTTGKGSRVLSKQRASPCRTALLDLWMQIVIILVKFVIEIMMSLAQMLCSCL